MEYSQERIADRKVEFFPRICCLSDISSCILDCFFPLKVLIVSVDVYLLFPFHVCARLAPSLVSSLCTP